MAKFNAAPVSVSTPAAQEQASIEVQSTPPGAAIELDGSFVASWTRKLNVTGGSIHLDAMLDPASSGPSHPSGTSPAAVLAPASH